VIGRDPVHPGLLHETADVTLRIGFHETVRFGVFDRRQHDRRARPAFSMQSEDLRQIDLRQHVAVEHNDRLREAVGRVLHRTTCTEGRWLHDVPDPDAHGRPVAEDLLDLMGPEVQAQDDLVDLRHLLEEVELVMEKRPVEDRHDRLRRMNRERPQARPHTPGQKDRLHDNPE
jgi:hypothetical protein